MTTINPGRCLWCGMTFDEHLESRGRLEASPKTPCLGLKENYREQSKRGQFGMRIYLAAPLFTSAERHWNKLLAQEIHRQNPAVEVWLPQDEEQILGPGDRMTEKIFISDVEGIKKSNCVVAIMDGSDPDSGTCWECGYAYAKGIPVFMVRTDFRGSGEDRNVPYNIMLAESALARAEMPLANIRQVAEKILEMIKA